MAEIPQTSITLLHALATSTANDQWYRFYDTYKGPVFGFIHANFPYLDPDAVFQDTLIALARCLPSFHYTPDEKGHFRNYLMGIVKHKALDILRKQKVEDDHRRKISQDPTFPRNPIVETPIDDLDGDQREAIYETAIAQLLADDNINASTRTIFERVVLHHEDSASVAAQFGTTRNNVYQIKDRLTERLKEIVQSLQSELEN